MRNPPDLQTASASTLGTDIPQVTARSKVLGRAMYAGDIKVAGMLHGKVLRSPYPHARIVSIDTTEALALPGVKSVLTGAEAPRAMWGVQHKEAAASWPKAWSALPARTWRQWRRRPRRSPVMRWT